jgi:hypothetical protein
MKKLLFIVGLGLSINCFGQKADSIAYCEVRISKNPEGGPYYIYAYTPVGTDGSTMVENGKCKGDLRPLGKLGAQGWHVVSFHTTEDRNIYILEKVYKRE